MALPALATITIYRAKPISSGYTLKAIETEVVYADGNEVPWSCSLHRGVNWPTLVIPLRENQRAAGNRPACASFENRLFSSPTHWGVVRFIRAQILPAVLNAEGALSGRSQRSLHAQVNPHFLFNALNTIKAVIRRDSEQPKCNPAYGRPFSQKFKTPVGIVTLADEIRTRERLSA